MNSGADNSAKLIRVNPYRSWVIEDSDAIRHMTGEILRQRGHQVREFSDAEAAGREWAEDAVDIVVLDWMLPLLSGIEFCRQLRTRAGGKFPVVVMLTARTDPQDIQECLHAGADDYIAKPFRSEFLGVRLGVAEARVRDRLAQRTAESQLAEAGVYLESIFDSVAAGILVVEAESHKILECNQAAAQMVGAPCARIVGNECHNFVCPSDRDQCPMNDPGASLDQREARLLCRGNKERQILKNAKRARYRGCEVIIESFVDITEIKSAQMKLEKYASAMERLAETRAQQLLHAERLVTLGTLSAGIAHELNNPLASVAANAQLADRYWQALSPELAAEMKGDARRAMVIEEMPQTLSALSESAQAAIAIVRNVREFSRRSGRCANEVSLRELLDRALRILQHEMKYGVQVYIHIPDDLPPLTAEGQKLEQVFLNLFANAAQAMNGKGELRVTVTREKAQLRIVVDDTGPGFTPEALKHLFEPFFTTKPPSIGTGLGLPIVSQIVKEHGGRITACNRAEGGARFVIELPPVSLAAQPAPDETKSADCAQGAAGSGFAQIIDHLVGDDDAVVGRAQPAAHYDRRRAGVIDARHGQR